MILPINIDLTDLTEEFALTTIQSGLLSSNIIDRIVTEYTTRWEDLVNEELKKSRAEYKRAMYIDRTGPSEVIFGLTARESPLAMMIEEGASPFDEKPGFQRSSKAKQKIGGGWYLTIPFRHATPEAVAESGIFSSIMPKEVYDIAKVSGQLLKKSDLPPQYQALGTRKAINIPGLQVPEYIHKAPRYQGLTKVNIQSTPNEKRSGYFTFRRVSDNSDPNSWWNGGILPKKLMDKALERAQIEKVVQMAIDNFLENI